MNNTTFRQRKRKAPSLLHLLWIIPLLWALALFQTSFCTVFPVFDVTWEIIAGLVIFLAYRFGGRIGGIAGAFGGYFLDVFYGEKMLYTVLVLAAFGLLIGLARNYFLWHILTFLFCAIPVSLLFGIYRAVLWNNFSLFFPYALCVFVPALLFFGLGHILTKKENRR